MVSITSQIVPQAQETLTLVVIAPTSHIKKVGCFVNKTAYSSELSARKSNTGLGNNPEAQICQGRNGSNVPTRQWLAETFHNT